MLFSISRLQIYIYIVILYFYNFYIRLDVEESDKNLEMLLKLNALKEFS